MTEINDDDVAAMAALLKMTIEHALRASRQSLVLTELLVSKGVVRVAEIDAKMRSTDAQTNEIMALLETFVSNISKPKPS